ncbi:hypothetical protein CK203_038471 [Vitis vinifera]|uniref:Uncharacterized protein n=1 Tax=Vitis vinifera TaxID=29760 RepID=A0A438IRW4_VITVI|nr:hypothetical protein CK203_038471 [Vitis vinifera]
MGLAVEAFGLKIPDLDLVCVGVFMGASCEVVFRAGDMNLPETRKVLELVESKLKSMIPKLHTLSTKMSKLASLERKEGGRVFKLELRSNNAGRFLQYSILSSKGKRFSLIFPEGRGVEWVWKTLASKWRTIGVVPANNSS